MAHGREIAQNVAEGYMGHAQGPSDPDAAARIKNAITAITDEIRNCYVTPPNRRRIKEKIRDLHERAGYNGDYMAWIKAHMPERLEHILGVKH